LIEFPQSAAEGLRRQSGIIADLAREVAIDFPSCWRGHLGRIGVSRGRCKCECWCVGVSACRRVGVWEYGREIPGGQ
jgi:hypothetical protein